MREDPHYTSEGVYWTSGTIGYGTVHATALEAHESYNRPNYNVEKITGAAVRCVSNTTHSLTLDTNDGTSHTLTQTGTSDNGDFVFTLPNYEPTRDGYEFVGWSTSPSATTADYQPGDNITATTANTTLYAVWVQPVTYTTTFNAGEGATLVDDENLNGSSSMSGVSTTGSYTFTLPSATKNGWDLIGWDTATGVVIPAYRAGGEFTTSTADNTLYAIWEESCPSGICYYNNDGTGTIMKTQEMEVDVVTMLQQPDASRSGYSFAGWTIRRDGAAGGLGPDYMTSHEYPAWKLYAKWESPAGDMQSFSGCSEMERYDTIALRDTRDGQLYTVAKMGDGKCWMTENLRLDLSTHGDQINATNTNNPSESFVSAAAQKPSSSNEWCTTDNAACQNQIVYNTQNTTGSGVDDKYLYGNYYNWYTATAGNGVYNFSGFTSGDICPAGWHLPIGESNGTYGELYDMFYVGSSVFLPMQYPFNAVYAGYYKGSAIEKRGTEALYALSSTTSTSSVYPLHVYKGTTGSGSPIFSNYEKRDIGFSVRCVANY